MVKNKKNKVEPHYFKDKHLEVEIHFAYRIFSFTFLYEHFLFVCHWIFSQGLSWEYASISSNVGLGPCRRYAIILASDGLVYEHICVSRGRIAKNSVCRFEWTYVKFVVTTVHVDGLAWWDICSRSDDHIRAPLTIMQPEMLA